MWTRVRFAVSLVNSNSYQVFEQEKIAGKSELTVGGGWTNGQALCILHGRPLHVRLARLETSLGWPLRSFPYCEENRYPVLSISWPKYVSKSNGIRETGVPSKSKGEGRLL